MEPGERGWQVCDRRQAVCAVGCQMRRGCAQRTPVRTAIQCDLHEAWPLFWQMHASLIDDQKVVQSSARTPGHLLSTNLDIQEEANAKYQISNIKYQISNIKYQISNIKYQISKSKELESILRALNLLLADICCCADNSVTSTKQGFIRPASPRCSAGRISG